MELGFCQNSNGLGQKFRTKYSRRTFAAPQKNGKVGSKPPFAAVATNVRFEQKVASEKTADEYLK